MADINITESLDDRDVVAAFARQLKLMEGLEKRMTALGKESKKAGELATNGFKDVAKAAAGWAMSVISVRGAYSLIVDSAREARAEAEKTSREFDNIFRKFNTLNNLKGLEAESAKKGIMENALKHSFTVQQSTAASIALASAGFSPEEVSGEAGSALLYGMAAQGEVDADPSKYAAPAAGYLIATGREKTGKNLTEVLQGTASLNATNFQLSHLPDLAKEAGSMGRMSPQEQFAAMATLMELTPGSGSEAATGLKAISLALTAKGGNKKAVKALAKMGINPDDIDMIGEGESFAQAMTTMKKGLDTVPEKDRDDLMAQFIGIDHFSAFKFMMDNVDEFQKNMGRQKDTSGYESQYKIATTGRGAAERRLDAQLAIEAAGRDQEDDLVLKARERMMRGDENISGPSRAISQALYNTARFVGASQETANRISLPGFGSGGRYSWENVQGEVARAKDPEMSEQTQILKDIRDRLPAGPAKQQVTPPVLNSGKPTR